MELVPVLVVAALPFLLAGGRRLPRTGVALWLASLGLLALWFGALLHDMEHADATGGPGSALAGWGWLAAAGAAAVAAGVLARRDGERRARRR